VRALVIGASGLVGGALMRALGEHAVGTYRSRPRPGLRPLEAADAEAVGTMMSAMRPEIVFFPAAEPNVDWCEGHPDDSYAANVVPALTALAAARDIASRFLFFSSDYVFDGTSGPYDEESNPAPLCVYGRQKLLVEERVLAAGGTVVRTTTVYGAESPPGKNFVLRVISRLRAHEVVRVPADQYSTPTWVEELAYGAVTVAARAGIWHVAGPEQLARDRFAALIARIFALDESLIQPVATAELGQIASRPLRAGLRTDKLRRHFSIAFLPTADALSEFAGREARAERRV
jgi:dTDP-4-dehydrorhamnose reductase